MKFILKYFHINRPERKNLNEMKELIGGWDDHTKYWITFLCYFPLPDKLLRVVKKQKKVSQRIGVVSKHLIKVAKEVGIPQSFIDHYCKVKKNSEQIKFYREWSTDLIDNHKETDSVSNNIKQLLEVNFRVGQNLGHIKDLRSERNKITYLLIESVLQTKLNQSNSY